jgi:hypothetical protein
MHQKVQKHFFCDIKVENFDKKCLTLSKKTRKLHLNIFASIDQIPSWIKEFQGYFRSFGIKISEGFSGVLEITEIFKNFQ